ncbi:TPA: restriction endonuclease subunit S, partial [Haemophilus influenzae]
NELVNHKFFLYYFTAPFILNSLLSKKNSSNQGYLKAGQIESLKIPIPPLSVQTEIVKILDALTALTSELTSELILRQKQYEYYREKLLSFDSLKLSDGVVQWIKLINLGELIRGNGLQKKDFTETGVPAIHYGQIYTYYGTFATKTKSFVSPELAKKLKKAKYGDVLIAGTSENFKDVMKPLGWLGSEIAFSGDMFAFRPNKRVNTKYLTYILQTERFYKFKEKYAQGTKVIRVKADNFLNYEIPLPTLEEQHRIVSILDKFETLTNSITEGLPLAIEQSQKRYEYYRELLLNFKQ